MRRLVSGLMNQRGRTEDVVPHDLDGRGRILGPAIPEPHASLQDRRSQALVYVSEDDGRGVAQLVQQEGHAVVGEDVASSQQTSYVHTRASVDGVGKKVERGFC